jgi:hypothetical protein
MTAKTKISEIISVEKMFINRTAAEGVGTAATIGSELCERSISIISAMLF